MSLGLVSFQFRMLCHPPLRRSDPAWPASSGLSPAKARVSPLSRVPDALRPAALPPHAAADKSSAKPAPRLPPSRASTLPLRTSGLKPADGDLLPSSPGPSRPRFRCQPQAETRSTTAKPGLHTDALTATRTVLAGPDRIPPPPRRETNFARH